MFSFNSFREAQSRRSQRRTAKSIAHLDPHLLRDIGIEPRDAGPSFSALIGGRM